ncbi:AI-2E family transporter [Alkalibaculum bacchi]|uniref:AI-2E family transporter n=1 Tax=Alkalibaculum bacchi TaxID=645887 RepID=UPI001474818B|nr:AI-2E family transporter [Alkalibaculum bacchi]
MNKLKIRAELKPYLYLGLTLCMVLLFYKVVTNIGVLMDSIREGISFVVGIFKPLFWGLILFYFLIRPVKFLDKKFLRIGFFRKHVKYSRIISILLIYFCLFFLVYLVLLFILPQIWQSIRIIISGIPSYIRKVEDIITKLHLEQYINYFVENSSVTKSSQGAASSQGIGDLLSTLLGEENLTIQDTLTYLIESVIGVGNKLFRLILSLFLSIYLLLDSEVLGRQIISAVKSIISKETYRKWTKTLGLMDETFYKFFIGKIYCSIFVASFVFVGLILLKVPHSSLISLIILVLNIIPYFGPIVGGAIGVLITLFNSPNKVVWVLGLVILAGQLEDNLLGPKVLGNQIGLKPFWIMISVIIGGEIFGIGGMFLAVPTFAILKVFIVEWMTKRNA